MATAGISTNTSTSAITDMTLRDAWRDESDNWIRFARTPHHDRYYFLLNLPHFLELLTPPGRVTVDVGCGEGRVGRELEQRGHHVVGFDFSEPAVRALMEYEGDGLAAVADAGRLPLPSGSVDLVTAFMSLQDLDDPAAAIHEVARVLRGGGAFCFALLHPFVSAGDFADDKDNFVIDAPYWNGRRINYHTDRDGIGLTFWQMHRPLGVYTAALEDSGLMIEALREPRPDDAAQAELGSTRLMPVFLHGRARKP
jgi:SAM-dependent methyltransferase